MRCRFFYRAEALFSSRTQFFGESIESNEVLQLMSHRPHFDPLKQYSEEFREGFALPLGMMVNFVKLVGKTLKATPDEPRCMFENIWKELTDLEKHGFTNMKGNLLFRTEGNLLFEIIVSSFMSRHFR
ncbi:hypothetical protein FRX31_034590 [Thalictrum thalictroides]|uniref:Uncharacterized protein n=1 Tax=Thalictrum thalictroides TaxID=46969 RepID=A0A7J6UTC0_THATH|nr:hypothetical protein FRX31_034590 [Thalictrum thalictroides]